MNVEKNQHVSLAPHRTRCTFSSLTTGRLESITVHMKAPTMKKLVCSIALAVLILAGSGCATSSCNDGLFGGRLFQGRLFNGGFFQGQPVRSLFRGAPCSTCNPPAGRPSNCDSNVAPLCQNGNCGSGGLIESGQAPVYDDPGVPYYGSPVLSSPQPTPADAGQIYSAPVQGSSRVPYGVTDESMNGLPMIDAFGSGVIDADILPPSL